jgi:ferric-dicitrate binding protein FerR (iron transport regulator)
MKSLQKISLVFALVLLLIIVSSANVHAQNRTESVVVSTRGYAHVKLKTSTSPAPIVKGTRLGVGDEIETGDNGKVELRLPDNSKIVIGANSRVVINELDMVEVTRVSTSTFDLLKGKIRAIVTPFVSKDSRFNIETDNATVGVRGTEFGVTREPDAGTTHLLTIGGTVYLTLNYFPDLSPIPVVGGEEITVTGNEQPPKPSNAPGEEIYQFLQEMRVSPTGGDGDHGGGHGGSSGGGGSR